MSESRVLVVGATGQLGRVIVGRLVRSGARVRALARNQDALAALAPGAEIAPVDLRDLPMLTEACRGVEQIVATANNNLGKGANSPTRIDLSAYQNLCAAARNTRVRRLIYVSYRGVAQDAPVDIFRVKWYIEDAIRRSGVPYVMLRPTAFMEVWIDQILAKGLRQKGVATIFGDGRAVANYIAVDDVAEFAVRILARPEAINEAIEIGGPSNLSMNDLATLVERRLKSSGKRRHVPVAALRLLPPLVRPFNEVAARLMTLGFYAATMSTPFPGWKASADRFGVVPRTVEAYLDEMTIRDQSYLNAIIGSTRDARRAGK
jgi:NADH dehydrogenase